VGLKVEGWGREKRSTRFETWRVAHYVFACFRVRHNALPTKLLGAFMKDAMLFKASGTLIKKENEIFLIYKEIQIEWCQSHL
jgi:hypothetical protein